MAEHLTRADDVRARDFCFWAFRALCHFFSFACRLLHVPARRRLRYETSRSCWRESGKKKKKKIPAQLAWKGGHGRRKGKTDWSRCNLVPVSKTRHWSIGANNERGLFLNHSCKRSGRADTGAPFNEYTNAKICEINFHWVHVHAPYI